MKNELTAKRIQFALSNANMKPQELAERSGVSKSSISQYVNGSHAPSNISSDKIGKVLGVNPLWLMGFDIGMNEPINKTNNAPSSIQGLSLSNLEKEIILAYRNADEIGKAVVLRSLGLDNKTIKGDNAKMA